MGILKQLPRHDGYKEESDRRRREKVCVCVCVTLKRHMQFVPTKESFWEETVLSKVQEVSVYTGRRLYVERVIG